MRTLMAEIEFSKGGISWKEAERIVS
jgi:hypothetical protein